MRTVRRVGDRALLVECADLAEVHGLSAALATRPPDGVAEVLPGARTVLVLLTRPTPDAVDGLVGTLAVLPAGDGAGGTGAGSSGAGSTGAGTTRREVVVDVVYDGEDLAVVAAALGTSVDGVVTAHAAHPWTVAFLGFAPGFAYLERDGAPLDVPRRDTPRTAVPAGAVALAGPYSAVYPRTSPGGWQLIGRTSAPMWDLGRPDPALVRAGDRVLFRPVREVVELAAAEVAPAAGPGPGVRARPRPALGVVRALEVVHPGMQSLVQDLGRPGHLALGVGRSGAADRAAAVRANRLVGNPRGAAVVETVLGGLTLRAHGTVVLAVTGAATGLVVHGPDGVERDRPAPGAPFAVHDGATVVVEPPAGGLRSYVAVRGGLGVDPVLGSRATDVLAALGPPPLAAGDLLPVLPPPPDAVAAWADPPPAADLTPTGTPTRARVTLGPRDTWLTAAARRALVSSDWLVTPDSNRVGLRLAGDRLARAVPGELPSEGVVAGAVQVPPSGQPVVFLADHPVTGGYPVVAVVRDADLDRLAQVRPGDRLRLVLG